VQRLRDLDWIEGRTIAIEYRWAEGRDERFAEIAAEFVRLKVDVIVTSGTALLAAKHGGGIFPKENRHTLSVRSLSRRRAGSAGPSCRSD
jgi:hypothetical protein